MSIEKYMDEYTYQWKKYSEFERLSARYVVVSEFTPCGEESELYILHEKNNIVYNDKNEMLSRYDYSTEEFFLKDKNILVENEVSKRIINLLNSKAMMFLYPNEEENFSEAVMTQVSPNQIEYIGSNSFILTSPRLFEEAASNEINVVFPDMMEEYDDLHEELLKIEKAFPDKTIHIDYSAPYTKALYKIKEEMV